MKMTKGWALATLAVLLGGPVHADIILETASLGQTGVNLGVGISNTQYLGNRFQLEETTSVGCFGGHMYISGGDGASAGVGDGAPSDPPSFFGVIVALDGPDDLPDGNPFSDDVLQVYLFRPDSGSSDYLVSANFELSAGWYALVFGSGEVFGGTPGNGGMPHSDQVATAQYDGFFWSGVQWIDPPGNPERFVIANGADCVGAEEPLALQGENIFGHGFEDPVANIVATKNIASEYDSVDSDVSTRDGEYTITLPRPSVGTTTVNYTISGSATAPDDFQPLTGSVEIPDGESRGVIPVIVRADEIKELEELLVLTLAPGAGYNIGVPASASVVFAPDPDLVPYVYWTEPDSNAIWRAQLDAGVPEVIYESSSIRSLRLDTGNGWVYWAQGRFDNRIFRSRLDGSEKELLITGLAQVEDLELDLVNGKLYWLDFDAGAIKRANLDGSGLETLLSGVPGIRTIALDPAADKLFYTSEVLGLTDRILQADLDGASSVEIVAAIFRVTDLEADRVNGRLYSVSNSLPDGISAVDYSGLNREVVSAQTVSTDLRVRGPSIYYVSNISDVRKMDLGGGNDTQVTSNFNFSPAAFDIDTENSLVYTNGDGLVRIDFAGNTPEVVHPVVNGPFHDVALDGSSLRLLFAGDDDAALYSVSPGGFDLQTLATDPSLARTRGMAIDNAGGRVYWANVDTADVNPATNQGIYSSKLDGSDIMRLTAPGIGKPHDVALDRVNGRMYWTQNITSDENPNMLGAIRAADLSGANDMDILTGESSVIRGIAVDATNGRIYWTEHSTHKILGADIDGNNRAAVHSSLDNPHDVIVDEANGKLYWTDGAVNAETPMSAAIRRSDLNGANPEAVISGLPAELRDIKLVLLPE